MTDAELIAALRRFNPPDRTLDYAREWAQAIHDAANRIGALIAERDQWRCEAELQRERKIACEEFEKRTERAEAERDALRKDAERLRDSCAGMIGLVQLIASRDDLPTGLDDLILLNHRVTEAKSAIDATIAAAGESPAQQRP